MCEIPQAAQIPSVRTFHGDEVVDPYDWMRQKDSQEVQDFVSQQNAYCENRTKHLTSLRKTLFEEFTSHIVETDMSAPLRVRGYWYFVRTTQGLQYPKQCRVPVLSSDNWDPPTIDPTKPFPDEEVIFDANEESQGHDFFSVGGLDLSHDGQTLLYGIDTTGDERYDYYLRDLRGEDTYSEVIRQVADASISPDGKWVFYTLVDETMRPWKVCRHKVGSSVSEDLVVFEEHDPHFWVDAGFGDDDRRLVITTASKTTSEVWVTLPGGYADISSPVIAGKESTSDAPAELSANTSELSADTSCQAALQVFIPRQDKVMYDVEFSHLPGDFPVAVVIHNVRNPNYEIDIHALTPEAEKPTLFNGKCIAQGSPYGCEEGDRVEDHAGELPLDKPWSHPQNPQILQESIGLAIGSLAIRKHAIVMTYRESGVCHLAWISPEQALEDWKQDRPWSFRQIMPEEVYDHGTTHSAIWSIAPAGNPSFESSRIRYVVSSYTHPSELSFTV